MNAVIWTDFVQCVIMLAGSLTLLVVTLVKVGGYNSLMERFPKVRPKETWENMSMCAAVPENFLHLIRSADDPEVRTEKPSRFHAVPLSYLRFVSAALARGFIWSLSFIDLVKSFFYHELSQIISRSKC